MSRACQRRLSKQQESQWACPLVVKLTLSAFPPCHLTQRRAIMSSILSRIWLTSLNIFLPTLHVHTKKNAKITIAGIYCVFSIALTWSKLRFCLSVEQLKLSLAFATWKFGIMVKRRQLYPGPGHTASYLIYLDPETLAVTVLLPWGPDTRPFL